MPPWGASSERQLRHSMTTVDETEAAGGCPDTAFPRGGNQSPHLAHSHSTRPTSTTTTEEALSPHLHQGVAGEVRATSPQRARGLGGERGASFADIAAMRGDGGASHGGDVGLCCFPAEAEGTKAAAAGGGPNAAAIPGLMRSPFSIPEGGPHAEAPQQDSQEELLRPPPSAAPATPSATGAPRLTVLVPSTPKPAVIGLASVRASGFLGGDGGGVSGAAAMPPAGLELFGCQHRVPVFDSPEDLLWLDPDNLYKLRQNIEVRLQIHPVQAVHLMSAGAHVVSTGGTLGAWVCHSVSG